MSTQVAELPLCLCGCGNRVRTENGKWLRGHSVRGVDGYKKPGPDLLPSPDDPFEDLGELEPEPEPEPEPAAPVTEDLGNLPPDPPPSWAGDKGKPKRGRPAGSRSKPKVTADARRDIEAKFGLMLQIPGQIWAARDPICGGTFMAQEPQVRAAGLELIMQSPDLIAFFTSTAGGFMLWLNLIMALQPVALTVWAHHIAHTIQLPEGEPQAERQYAA